MHGDFQLHHTTKMADIQVVQFRKGSSKLSWKSSLGESNWKSGEFLKKKISDKIKNTKPKYKSVDRGIPLEKKNGILKELCPLMTGSSRVFWETLSTCESSADLIDEFE
jgi:hypothetical protein